ncbi:hypothetical protein [Archangium sp.]|uniref:hypothetical protein n=1 Tax=Archangium sp. TaxID=1872627 RepID=UPI00389ABA56
MAGNRKTRLALAGLLATSVASGTLGCQRADAEPRAQDILQQQQEQQQGGDAQQDSADDTRSRDRGTGDTGRGDDQGPLDEPGTGGAGTTDEGMTNEPGTSGSRGTGGAGVFDEDEGVLQPGVNDEGLDDDEGQADQDTVNPGTRPPPER